MTSPVKLWMYEFRPGDADLYRKAADLISSGKSFCKNPACGWACCALAKAVPSDDNNRYHRLIKPFRDMYSEAPWFGKEKTAASQMARREAMLWMAEQAKCLTEFVP
jgi:hypothetical protein